MGRIFASEIWGLIFERACFWRGLLSEFYGSLTDQRRDHCLIVYHLYFQGRAARDVMHDSNDRPAAQSQSNK